MERTGRERRARSTVHASPPFTNTLDVIVEARYKCKHRDEKFSVDVEPGATATPTHTCQDCDAMDKAAALRPESRFALARVGIGVVVRQGAPLPNISGPDAVRKTLLDARSIAYPDAKATGSGTHLSRVLAQ